MGQNKRTYMEIYDPLAERYYGLIQRIIKDEEMYYACLGDVKTQYANKDCDTRPYIEE